LYIKKTSDRNEYILAEDIWVRNFTKDGVPYQDINRLITRDDYYRLINNEFSSLPLNIAGIDQEEGIRFSKVVLISDGYDFEERHKILSSLPNDVTIFAVNGALRKWTLARTQDRRSINVYVINNPYDDAKKYLPIETKYYPTCITSSRTHYNFLEKYKGNMYCYEPSSQEGFGHKKSVHHCH